MKIFNKLRILGAAAAFVLMASPLAQAASKPGLDEVLKANALLDQAPAVQYNLKGTFFTPIISGNVIAAGQIQDPKEKDAPNQMKMEGKGTVTLVMLGAKKPMEQAFTFYAIQKGNTLDEYIHDGKTWKKHSIPFTSPTEKEVQQGTDTFKKNVKSTKIVSDKGKTKVIDVTLDSQKLFKTNIRNDKTEGQKAVKKALKKMGDLTYRATIDKKSGRLVGLFMDLTPLLRTSGKEILEAATITGQVTPQQQEMAQAFLSSSTLQFELSFAYDKGTDIVLPEAAKNATEIKGKAVGAKALH